MDRFSPKHPWYTVCDVYHDPDGYPMHAKRELDQPGGDAIELLLEWMQEQSEGLRMPVLKESELSWSD